MSQARLGQGVKRLTKLGDQDPDRFRSLRIRGQIGERPAGKFLDHFVCAVAPSPGREDLGHVIAWKLAPSLSTIQMTELKSGARRSPAGRARAECERINARENN